MAQLPLHADHVGSLLRPKRLASARQSWRDGETSNEALAAIEDDDRLYAAWMHRKPSVHDVAMTGGASPRLHHTGYFTPEAHHILHLCDLFGAIDEQQIEPGEPAHVQAAIAAQQGGQLEQRVDVLPRCRP